MILHTIHFGEDNLYQRLAKVLAYSAKKNSPNTPIIIHAGPSTNQEIIENQRRGCFGHDIVNALKTKYHNEIVQNAELGEFICLMDLDMAVMSDLSEAEGDYDLGYTVRDQKARINSGIIFVRVSEKTKQWYSRWHEIVYQLLNDAGKLSKLKLIYSGINQSALGIMLQESHNLVLKEFPAKIWNLTPVHYNSFNSETKVIHMLNHASALSQPNGTQPGAKVAKAWLALEKESTSALL